MTVSETLPPIRASEGRALEAAQQIDAERILCTTLGRAQAAISLANERPHAQVTCWFLDDYEHRLAAPNATAFANLSLSLSADVPDVSADLAVIPLAKNGEAELARDLLQSAWSVLDVSGSLVTAVDNPHDRWVREQLGAWFDRVRTTSHDDATVYVATKTAAPRKVKYFRCEFAFRDRGSLLRAVSRPGVFSHRRVDPGARQLLAAADPSPEARILDIGCGAGVVGLALAARDPSCAVLAVDSHTRAVQCTHAGAELNSLSNVSTLLNSSGDYGQPECFDLALLNPPYYADFAIAALFLTAAHRSLTRGGRVIAVTKRPDWYAAEMPAAWSGVEVRASKSYHIVTAITP
jgi:16S rRNA G1207 methylase RsmC